MAANTFALFEGGIAMTLTPKENYFKLLRGEIPDYVPSMMFDPCMEMITEDMIAPVFAPNGPITTVYGVEYVGSKEMGFGAMPTPGKVLLHDITKWRDVIKNPDTSDRDWEGYYKKQTDKMDRVNKAVSCHGGDYFLTLVSFMGFTEALMAMYEAPEEVYALFDYVSEHYLEVMRQQIRYVKPELYNIMDDDSAYRAPFFSVEMYQKLIKPFHKKHADLARENGILLERHDCGKSESFIDDWLDIGIRSWNPAQVTNDLVAVKKKYTGRLTLNGCWDNQGLFGGPNVDDEVLREALYTYVDTFAPGGGFVFSAMIMVPPGDPAGMAKMGIIRDVYENYARDYYKTH
jgi:hypothetical protein